jgi:hypothetical protein
MEIAFREELLRQSGIEEELLGEIRKSLSRL